MHRLRQCDAGRTPVTLQPGYGRRVLDALDHCPDRIALRQGNSTLTYSQTRKHVLGAAARLEELGLRPGDTLVQIRDNDVWQWILGAACAVAGFRSCSIPPSLPADEASRRVAVAAPTLVITDELGEQVAAGFQVSSLADVVEPTAEFGRKLTDTSRVIRLAFTSGTGGQAKGVELSDAAMGAVAAASAATIPWPEQPTVICAEAVSGGFGNMILPTLICGGTVVLPTPTEPLSGLLDVYPGAVLLVMPPTLRKLLDESGPLGTPPTLLVYSGDVLASSEIDRVHRWAGPVLCGIYGQVEVPKTIAVLLPEEHLVPHYAASLGRPFPGTEWRVVDLDGHDVPVGQAGELWVRSATIMSGYATAEPARPPFAGDWLRTGDICRVEDDYAFHEGRIEDVLAHRPTVVCPAAVERRVHAPSDTQIALLPGHEDGDVVVMSTSVENAASIQEAIEESGLTLERFVKVEGIPRTWMGRIDRLQLRSFT